MVPSNGMYYIYISNVKLKFSKTKTIVIKYSI
jgi:hypothetical protein